MRNIWKHKGKIALAAILALAVYGGYYYKQQRNKKEHKEETLTELISRGNIASEITKDGFFQPKDSVEINSRADGRIKEIFVKEGDIVKKDQLLLIVQPGQSIHEKYLPVEVRAPMSGMVLRCLNARGTKRSETSYELPKAGESVNGTGGFDPTCIMKIVQPGKYAVPIKIDEYNISKVKVGMPVKISNLSQPEKKPYEGRIMLISPQPEIKEENFWDPDSSKVEFITVAETVGDIKDLIMGFSASVLLSFENKKDILMLPNTAIYEQREGPGGKINYFVYKQTAPKKAKKIQVKLGIKNNDYSELLNAEAAGLSEGDIIFPDYEGAGVEIEK